jgi:hypothetical protein
MAMNAMTRSLHLAIGGLCLGLAVIVAAEIIAAITDDSASTGRQAVTVAAATDEPAPPPDIDAEIADIVDRPVFTANRRPPPTQEAQDRDDGPAPATEPVLTGRLGGVMLGPDDEREAIFARDGDKPLAVKEGDEIDGWTVSSITPEGVVLSSAFGEKTVEPSFGVTGPAGAPVRPQAAPQRKMTNLPLAIPQQAQPGMTRIGPGFPQNAAPGAPPGPFDPNQARQRAMAARRNQRP